MKRVIQGMLAALAIAWAAAVAVPFPQAAAAEPAGRTLNTPTPSLQALLEGAETLPLESRRTLATLLVDMLIDAYAWELHAARLELTDEGANTARLTAWYRATWRILEALEAGREALPYARRIALRPEHGGGDIVLLLDGRRFWMSWPRPAARPQFERTIVAAYCAQQLCDDGPLFGHTDALAADQVFGAWSVTQQAAPTWLSEQGVQCAFASLSSRVAKEAVCRRVVVELHRLARAIDRARRDGASISWPDVALVEGGAQAEQRVVVNARGDHVVLPLSALASPHVDWEAVRRWLEARANGRSVVATVRRSPAGRR